MDNKETNCSASNGPVGDGDACAKRPSRMRGGQQVYQWLTDEPNTSTPLKYFEASFTLSGLMFAWQIFRESKQWKVFASVIFAFLVVLDFFCLFNAFSAFFMDLMCFYEFYFRENGKIREIRNKISTQI